MKSKTKTKKYPVKIITEIGAILDWAARDQDECRQCGDECSEKEALENLKTIERLRPLLEAAPDLLAQLKNVHNSPCAQERIYRAGGGKIPCSVCSLRLFPLPKPLPCFLDDKNNA